jgi:hypothetical protein
MDGRILIVIIAVFALAGCTMPWEEETGSLNIEVEEKESNLPPIRQVDKSVAIVDESAHEPEELEGEFEADPEEVQNETAGEQEMNESFVAPEEVNETVEEEPAAPEEEPVEELEEEPEEIGEPTNKSSTMLVEFDSELLLDCKGDCTRYRVYDEENDVAIAAINQSRLIMGKEMGHFRLYPLGCKKEKWNVVDKFEINGSEYWFDYPAAFKRDWADYAEFQGNESGFSLHEGEMEKLDGKRVFLWQIVPGAWVCDAYVEISIFDKIYVLEEWMDGVVLGLEEKEGELRLNYLMYPEGTLD